MFLVSLENYNCKISVSCRQFGADEAVNGSTLLGMRRENGESSWVTIFSRDITSRIDLDFTYYDRYTRSRRRYEYKLSLVKDGSTLHESSNTILCNFNSIYIADEIEEYVFDIGLNYDYDETNEISFQKLLLHKYPRRIQNGLADYRTGFVEVLPLIHIPQVCYTTEGAHAYKMQYISFLKNGFYKLIKTYKGDVWYAAVNGGIKVNQSDFEGAETVRFNFTEMGSPPVSDDGW